MARHSLVRKVGDQATYKERSPHPIAVGISHLPPEIDLGRFSHRTLHHDRQSQPVGLGSAELIF